jgi:acetyltransferase-like isoleucine patch superfamily enzyme
MRGRSKPQTWEAVQAQYADMPGIAGVEARRKHYAPFFLRMGHDVMIEEGCRFYHPDRIVLEDDVRINIGALIYGSGGIWIGRHARIGPRFFAHSANHDVEEGPTAYFERGYRYLPTEIGDNVLISANVSIMPGAALGSGTFVASGAVVTAGRYEQQSRLFGVPAVPKSAPQAGHLEGAPEIAFLVSDSEERKDAVLHLLSALGLPQVSVYTDGEGLPASLHTVILDGETGRFAPVLDGLEVWRIAAGERGPSEGDSWFDAPSGIRVALPDRVETSVVSDGREGEDRRVRGLEQTFYWLTTRLAKGAGRLSADEVQEWRIAFHVLGVEPGRKDRLRERIEELIKKRRTQGKPGKHVSLVLSALHSRTSKDALIKQAVKLSSTARGATDIIAGGIVAALLGENAVADQLWEKLETPDWLVPGVAMPRSAAGAKGFCYSPLVLVWLFLEARRENPGFQIPEGTGIPSRVSQQLEWRPVGDGEHLLDEASRTISRSFIDNWLILHEAPCSDGSQVVLEDFNYAQSTAPLEAAWREVFLFLQGRKGRPLVRVHPWPEGRKAAISLRYDVDRPVSTQTITEIVQSQSGLANAPCGSWYYFGGCAPTEGQARHLTGNWQEIGIHAEDPQTDPVAGLGVTHHSAPTSMYWRGSRTNSVLDERGAEYCEFLNAQTGTPRPAWIRGEDVPSRLGKCWTTPIHFPLEGSTSDVGLAYFDERLDRFRELLSTGGHCIVGTHPDLNQDLMEQLLRREDVANVWFATVGAVIKRCRQVMSPGAIRCVPDPSGGIALLSRESLADIHVTIRSFGSDEVKNLNLQLAAGQPRPLDVEAS